MRARSFTAVIFIFIAGIAPWYRWPSISTYIVGFVLFLAEYFWWTHFAQCLHCFGRDL
jgi:hypothetical protein